MVLNSEFLVFDYVQNADCIGCGRIQQDIVYNNSSLSGIFQETELHSKVLVWMIFALILRCFVHL